MILVENGYWQDGFKALVYLVPFIWLIAKRRELNLRYFWIFAAGLFLLLFGNILDFVDEFTFLQKLPDTETNKLLQDFLEDIIGFTLGFAIFTAGLYLEFFKKIK